MDDILKHRFIPNVETLTDGKLRRVVKLAASQYRLIHLLHACFQSPLVLNIESVRFLFELLHLFQGVSDFLEIGQLNRLPLLLQKVFSVNS